MFESALRSPRPRRRVSVALSTSLHAALCGALVLPPALGMPELAVDPPDNLPTFVSVFRAPQDDAQRRLAAPRPAAAHAKAASGQGGAPARVVTVPSAIGDLPKILEDGEREPPEVIGPHASDPPAGGTGDEGGSGDDPESGESTLPANGAGVTPPVALAAPAPVYPDAMRAAHLEGTVTLEAVIGRDGRVRDVRVLQGRNPLLDSAAITAVLSWRYVPARVDDRPVSVYLTVVINFRLR